MDVLFTLYFVHLASFSCFFGVKTISNYIPQTQKHSYIYIYWSNWYP